MRVFAQNIDSLETAAGLPKDMVVAAYLGIADGMSIARVWACRYSK